MSDVAESVGPTPESVALNRIADGIQSLVLELRKADQKTAKRVRTVARGVLVDLEAVSEHAPTELQRGMARRAVRRIR